MNNCPQCGKPVPEGSKFCNHCGAPMKVAVAATEIECPHCHASIPSDSVFCPECRSMVGKQTLPPKPSEPKTDAWKPAGGEQPQDGAESNHNLRNGLIIAAILAFVGLIVVRSCFFGSDKEITSLPNDSISNQSYVDIMNGVLIEKNLKNDGDKIAYALPFKSEGQQEVDKVIGLTYLSDGEGGKSFYRIYTLTKNGSSWDVKQNIHKSIDGHSLIFDQSTLRVNEIPVIENIAGKNYFCFAYADLPKSSDAAGDIYGKVSIVMYDIESGEIVRQADFSGKATTDLSGQTVIDATTYKAGTNFLDQRMIEHARSIGYLHIPTDEEIAEQKKEKEEEQAAKAAADSAKVAKAAQTVDALNNGETVVDETTAIDKNTPQFRAEDFAKKVTGGGYTVFLLKNGKVFAFNKASNKTFEVHFGGGAASDIGFADSGAGVLNIRTGAGRVQYNLNTKTMKKDAAASPATPAEAK